ncbi:MAG: sugar ABC transporter substrate-binding protein [Christensenellales bacterium]|jgi:ribose transport system substrate-binding protein
MNMKKLVALLLALVMVVAVLGACSSEKPEESKAPAEESKAPAEESKAPAEEPETPDAGGEKAPGSYTADDLNGMTLAFSPKTLNNPFFVGMEDGVKEVADQYGIKVESSAPPAETDIEQQISMIENFITKKVDGILLSPCGSSELVNVCKEAIAAGIPVFILDTPLSEDGEDVYTGFAGTNNYEGGVLAAEWMVEELGGAGKVGLMDGYAGNSATTARRNGFLDGIEGSDLEIVAEGMGNCERATGMTVAESFIQANPDLNAIFCCNDMMVLGTAEAVKQAGKEDQIIICGFDGQPEASQAILDGDVNATVAQRPKTMGKMGVEMFVKYMTGESFDRDTDTGCKIVTAENAGEYLEYT